jgi:ferredoxin
MSPSSGDSSLVAVARAAAISAAGTNPVASPEWVSFNSRGVVLVTGKAVRVMKSLDRLPEPLRVVAFVPDATDDTAVPRNVRLVAAPILSLMGHLGRFTATSVPVQGEPVDAGRFGWNEDRCFDLVLDLNDAPLLPREVGPYGYFAPRTDDDLAVALAAICGQPAMWRKPRYFDYRSELCTHGAAGVPGCNRCLDACPAGAIAGAGDRVAFDPYLCQGCGTCTAVCPDGAARYAYPPAETMLGRVRATLDAWRASGAPAPTLVVSTASDPPTASDSVAAFIPESLSFPVHALASFGIEAWFAALAWGAARVVLVAAASTTRASRQAISEELAVANAVLKALGEDSERVSVVDDPRAAAREPLAAMSPAATALPTGRKRTTLYAAIDHLSASRVVSTDVVRLPAGAALGAVVVDKGRCTLCLACTNLCPVDALTGVAGATPELRFREADCVQCGICKRGCPEKAISLAPQVQPRRDFRDEARVLCVDEPFACTRCGTPFISKRMLARTIEMMANDPLIHQEGIGRLKLCMPCRAHATMQDAVSGNS